MPNDILDADQWSTVTIYDSERLRDRSLALVWFFRILVLFAILMTWWLMITVVERVNEIRDDLRQHPRIVVPAQPASEENEIGDA